MLPPSSRWEQPGIWDLSAREFKTCCLRWCSFVDFRSVLVFIVFVLILRTICAQLRQSGQLSTYFLFEILSTYQHNVSVKLTLKQCYVGIVPAQRKCLGLLPRFASGVLLEGMRNTAFWSAQTSRLRGTLPSLRFVKSTFVHSYPSNKPPLPQPDFCSQPSTRHSKNCSAGGIELPWSLL